MNPMYEMGYQAGAHDAQAQAERIPHDDWPDVAQVGYADGYSANTHNLIASDCLVTDASLTTASEHCQACNPR